MVTEQSLSTKLRTSKEVVRTLLFHRSTGEVAEFRKTSHQSNTLITELPINREEDILYKFVKLIDERIISFHDFDFNLQYWSRSQRYDLLDIFNTTVQFFDEHTGEIPITTLPPVRDVRTYRDRVTSSNHRLTVDQQFEILLDITGNNPVGAANLGFIASRYFHRGADRRLYPELGLRHEDIIEWSKHLAQFEVYSTDNLMQPAGDTYYFWTHFFVALYCSIDPNFSKGILTSAFANGTSIMNFIRRYIAGGPPSTPHREGSIIGRNIGLAIGDLIKEASHK
jgi:hypothetical protein